MTTWTYASEQIEARNEFGALLLFIPTAPELESLVDLLNANRSLSRLVLAGFGHGEKLGDRMGGK